jgi:hypothetical protein
MDARIDERCEAMIHADKVGHGEADVLNLVAGLSQCIRAALI